MKRVAPFVIVPAVLLLLPLGLGGCGSKSGGTSGPDGFHFTVPGFTVPAGQEFYQCFFVHQDTGGTQTQARGAMKFSYTAETDVVHHVVVFTSDNGEADGTTARCDTVFELGWNFRYAGGKQTNALELPAGVAVQLERQTTWVLQFHYLNASTSDVVDHSSIDVDFTPVGEKFTKAGLAVGGDTGFTIPPTGAPYDVTGTCTMPSGFPDAKIFGLWPHMHQIGTHFKVEVTHGGVTTTPVDENWNFGDQKLWLYTGADEMPVSAGDSVKTTCTYVNNTGADVPYGESSTQEMCFNFIYFYPTPFTQSIPCL